MDILVNNVGVEFYREFVDVAVADWDRQIGVNLRSVFLCCSNVVPAMIKQGEVASSIRRPFRPLRQRARLHLTLQPRPAFSVSRGIWLETWAHTIFGSMESVRAAF